MKLFLILLTIILISWSCNQSPIIKKYSKNDTIYIDSIVKNQLINRKIILNDSCVLNFYYNNEYLIDSFKTINGLIEGERKFFHLNGKLKLIGTMYKNEPVSSWYTYYSSGKLQLYRFYNVANECIYVIYYNEDGTIKYKKGHGMTPGYYNNDTILINNLFMAKFFVATPPLSKSYCYLFFDDTLNNDKVLLEINKNAVNFNLSFSDTGLTKLIFKWYNYDLSYKIMEVDSLIFKVMVINNHNK